MTKRVARMTAPIVIRRRFSSTILADGVGLGDRPIEVLVTVDDGGTSIYPGPDATRSAL